MKPAKLALLPLLLALLPTCKSSSDSEPEAPADQPKADEGPAWTPGTRYLTERAPTVRGMLDRRGLIHAHSAFSHDACDGKPHDENGVYDQDCFDQFRKGLCDQQMDFVMASDHGDSFADNEFPDVLLYRPTRGDKLIERGGSPVANQIACEGRDPVLFLAGTETGMMPVGLERHVSGTKDERHGTYGTVDAATMNKYKELGAVCLFQHTEDWTVDQITTLPVDGFEMFNLHANAYRGAGAFLGLIKLLNNKDPGFPHPDLVIVPAYSEDPIYLSTWGSVLAKGARRVTTMGTDCHRNTFPQMLPDGERIDSYRRMMGWFSNHLLVKPQADGSYDDSSLKEALRAGRLYGAFEVLGVPAGFDYHAEEGGSVREMGEQAATGAKLVVKIPRVRNLDPKVEAPVITARILRAKEGGWDVVATDTKDLSVDAPGPGAYRAEIRMTPRHLIGSLGDYAESIGKNGDLIWIYSNAVYVQ